MHFLRRYDWILQVATIVLCAYFWARGLSYYFSSLLESSSAVVIATRARPPAETVAAAPEKAEGGYQLIVDRNIFNSKDLPAAEEASPAGSETSLGDLGTAVKTSLDVKIGSTLIVGDGTDRRSSAMIAVGKAKSKTYFIGDEEGFAPNVKLMKVEKSRIEFVNAGRLEYAELAETGKTIFAPAEEVFGKISLAKDPKDSKIAPKEDSASGGTIYVEQKDVDNALQHLDSLQREVNIAPNFQGGKLAGFRVIAVKPGGLVSKLGVRRGDVLQRVNGQDLDVKQGLQLFNSLKDSKNFSLEVLRGGQQQTLEYEIR